jgi:hypothetical protein
MFAVWPRSAYQGEGELVTFHGRSFCPKCGSHVVHITDEEAEIMLGSFDEGPSDLIPQYELWTPRREKWMQELPWADQFKGDRNDAGGDWRQPVREE